MSAGRSVTLQNFDRDPIADHVAIGRRARIPLGPRLQPHQIVARPAKHRALVESGPWLLHLRHRQRRRDMRLIVLRAHTAPAPGAAHRLTAQHRGRLLVIRQDYPGTGD